MFAVALKPSDGFSRGWVAAVTVVSAAGSFTLLALLLAAIVGLRVS